MAHALADFVYQTSWMVRNKQHPLALAAHGAVVLVTEYVIIGAPLSFAWALLVAYATISGLGVLPPLGISSATP